MESTSFTSGKFESPYKWPDDSLYEQISKMSEHDFWFLVFGKRPTSPKEIAGATRMYRRTIEEIKLVNDRISTDAKIFLTKSYSGHISDFLNHLTRGLCQFEMRFFPAEWALSEVCCTEHGFTRDNKEGKRTVIVQTRLYQVPIVCRATNDSLIEEYLPKKLDDDSYKSPFHNARRFYCKFLECAVLKLCFWKIKWDVIAADLASEIEWFKDTYSDVQIDFEKWCNGLENTKHQAVKLEKKRKLEDPSEKKKKKKRREKEIHPSDSRKKEQYLNDPKDEDNKKEALDQSLEFLKNHNIDITHLRNSVAFIENKKKNNDDWEPSIVENIPRDRPIRLSNSHDALITSASNSSKLEKFEIIERDASTPELDETPKKDDISDYKHESSLAPPMDLRSLSMVQVHAHSPCETPEMSHSTNLVGGSRFNTLDCSTERSFSNSPHRQMIDYQDPNEIRSPSISPLRGYDDDDLETSNNSFDHAQETSYNGMKLAKSVTKHLEAFTASRDIFNNFDN